MELYKKYRPTTFEDVLGQGPSVKVLKEMVKTKSLPQVILFSGPPGCGKTTLARILAAQLDVGELDLNELNSASFRGVESVREMARQAHYSILKEARVFILDEVHKWTNDAQNAALKLLEDTPKGNYFFLCTTDPDKLVKAVRTRCADIKVSNLSREALKELLVRVAEEEKIDLGQYADDIVDAAEGSARALLVILDRLQHLEQNEWEAALQIKGSESAEAIDLCRALLQGRPWKKIKGLLAAIQEDPETVRRSILGFMSGVLMRGGSECERAYDIISSFREDFWKTGKPGLVATCYEVSRGS